MCDAAHVLMVLASREASETFIAREIDALQQRGLPLEVATLDTLPRVACRETRVVWRRIMAELLAFAPRNAFRIWRHRREVSALVERARKSGATRLHAQFAWIAADVAGMAAEALQIPWACSVHAWDVFTRPTAELRRRLRGAEFVIACNRHARDVVAEVAPCHVHLIRHGVRPIRIDAARSTERICAIGRLVPKKGFDTLLAAMAKLHHCHAQCVIIGDGPEHGRLQRLAARLGIAHRVTFAWQLPHAAAMAALAQSTLLALPSRMMRDGDRDGFANVLTEAMQCGVPIVTTTVAGADELLADNESALLVAPDDPDLLATAIDRLLDDPALQKRLILNAQNTLETRLSEAIEIERTATLIFGEKCKPKIHP